MSRTSTALLILASLTTCGGSSKHIDKGPRNGPRPEMPWSIVSEEVYTSLIATDPVTAVSLGFHDYDGRLPFVHGAALEQQTQELRRFSKLLDRVRTNGRDQDLERRILRNEVRSRLFYRVTKRRYQRDPMYYAGQLELTNYVSRDYAPADKRARAIIKLGRTAPEFLQQAAKNLEPTLPKTWVETALLQSRGLLEFSNKDVPAAMIKLPKPLLAELDDGLNDYRAALQGYIALLEERLKTANDDFRLGEQSYLQMLSDTEGVQIPLSRLRTIAAQDLQRNLSSLAGATDRLAPGKTIHQAVEKVRTDRPAVDQVIAEAEAQSAQMREFLISKEIVSIPSQARAEVRPTPPFMRWNFAFLSSAGVFEKKDLPSFYYISPPNPAWPAKQQQDYVASRSDLLFVTIHEVWPGHFLHALHIKENPSQIAQSFCSYAMSEGWAHYTEEMMWDAGVGAQAPATHIGQLQNALLRNVRFVASLGLHTGTMTVAEAEELFVKSGFQDRASARQQAIRGTFDPGYLNYTLGKLMIRKLHDDWKTKRGKDYSLRGFHDEFLSYACAPIPVIREFMLGPSAGPAL